MIKSGFSPDDISYAVRWTFKNSRSRPESFSLIKHTMHLAMDDLIHDLKNISGEKELVKKKTDNLRKNIELENGKSVEAVSDKDNKTWVEIYEELKECLNEHSFKAFIEHLKLIAVDGDLVTLKAQPDSVSWIIDHYLEQIEQLYNEKKGKDITVRIE